MKKILFSALMACFALTASAQISEGAPSAKKYTTGNRPLKGTYGLYIGAETDLFNRVTDGFDINPLPIVNIKYFATDNLELRVGMKFWKQRESLHFGYDATDDADEVKTNMKAVLADNQVRPGFAYHFAKTNLLDVYAGVEGIVGWTRNTLTNNDGGDNVLNVRNATIQFGAGAFIGLQAFVARLPLAVGLEYGISTVWDGGLRSKTYTKSVDAEGAVTETTTYAKSDTDIYGNALWKNTAIAGAAGDGDYDFLKARKGAWGNQIRLTLSYYFNR